MSNHVYKSIELTGTSPDGISEAVQVAIDKARQTLHGLDWFELSAVRGHIHDGRIEYFQASIKVGFRLD